MNQAIDGVLDLIAIFWVSLFNVPFIFGYSIGGWMVAGSATILLVNFVKWILSRSASTSRKIGRDINAMDRYSKRKRG